MRRFRAQKSRGSVCKTIAAVLNAANRSLKSETRAGLIVNMLLKTIIGT